MDVTSRVPGSSRRRRSVVAAVCLLPMLAACSARADQCHPTVEKDKPQYTIGYGSLMETESKRRTAPNTGANLPVMVTGFQRSWNTKGSEIGFSTTYLGVVPQENAQMVAAFYRVFSADDILATDEREAFYCRVRVLPDQIRMLEGSTVPRDGQIWIYVNKPDNVVPPSVRFPIVQSYVDIFVTGCFQLAEKVVGENIDFAKACIETTSEWSEHWVNDRLYPRRAFTYQPNAYQIDSLLQSLLPEFKDIRIE